MLRITAALVFLSPAIASAQCVTAEALSTGVTVQYANGNSAHIQSTDYGTVIEGYTDTLSYYEQTILFETIDGVFEARRVLHEKGHWARLVDTGMDYDFDTDTARPYAVGSRGHGTLSLLSEEEGVSNVAFGWAVYESEPLVVGECSYEAVRVFTSEFDVQRGDVQTREVQYLPELGFGLQLGNSYFSLPANSYDIASMVAD